MGAQAQADLFFMRIERDRLLEVKQSAKYLHAAFFVMHRDWKDGDFDLPPLARIHMEAMESKAIELGRLLFRQHSAIEALADNAAPTPPKTL
jgi:hypothetical protein